MRKVVSKQEVARLWAGQHQQEARVQRDNFYFNGKTIYSYGSHFPIARIEDGRNCLFTLMGYSNSTAKHINETYHAANRSGLNIIYCADIESEEKSLKYWQRIIENTIEEIKNPKNRKFESRVGTLEHTARQVRAYIEYKAIELPFEFAVSLAFIESGNIVEKLRVTDKKIKPVKQSGPPKLHEMKWYNEVNKSKSARLKNC